MYINPINNINFKSRREDNNYVKKLATSKEALNENLEINIIKALDALSQDASTQNIKFLLDTAKKLNYGYRKNSEFKKQIFATSPIANQQLANYDWENALKSATKKALALNNTPDTEKLKNKFSRIFHKNIPLTKTQEEIVNLRTKILKSRVLSQSSEVERVQNIKKNLDYFLFSSEISYDDKKNCLGQIAHFLSKDYRINPQLKGKKVQVLDEIMNDIVIQTPEQARIKIKNVNQKRHGMCGAISVCRKLAAYEDKPNYLSNIFSELSASPYMEIYDITQLGTGKKNSVKKVEIDFEDALARGYRIIDASALQWMQNAARTGDGVTLNEIYVPFDKENYELYKDSFWLNQFPKDLENVHEILKSTIQARKIANTIQQQRLEKTINNENFNDKKSELITQLAKNRTDIDDILRNSGVEENKVLLLRNQLLSLEDANKSVMFANYNKKSSIPDEYAINPNYSANTKKEIMKRFILNNSSASEKQLDENLDNLFNSYNQNNSINAQISSVGNSYGNLASKAAYYKNLFSYAVAYRTAVDNFLNDDAFLEDYLVDLNIPNRKNRINEHLVYLANDFPTVEDERVIGYYSHILQTDANKDEVVKKLKLFTDGFMSSYNEKYDEICSFIGLDGQKGFLTEILNSLKIAVEANDKRTIGHLAIGFGIKPFKADVLKKLERLTQELETQPSEKTYNKVFDSLKITDNVAFLDDILKTVATVYFYPDAEYAQTGDYLLAKSIIDKYSEDENFKNNLSLALTASKELQMRLETIEEAFSVASAKEYVLDAFERKLGVLRKEELDDLAEKFLSIEQNRDARDNATNNNKKYKNREVYIFNSNQLASLNKVQNNFKNSLRLLNRLYSDLNKEYKEDIDDAYRALGRSTGSYWVHEEGGSGLLTSAQFKILSQIYWNSNYYGFSLSF